MKLMLKDIVDYELDDKLKSAGEFISFKKDDELLPYIDFTLKKNEVIKKGQKVSVMEILVSSFGNGHDLNVKSELLANGIAEDSLGYEEAFNTLQNGYFKAFKYYYPKLSHEAQFDFLKCLVDRWQIKSKHVELLSKIVDVILNGAYVLTNGYRASDEYWLDRCLERFTDFAPDYKIENNENLKYIKHLIEADKNALGALSSINSKALADEYTYCSSNQKLAYNFGVSKIYWREIANFVSCFEIDETIFNKKEIDRMLSENVFRLAMDVVKNKPSHLEIDSFLCDYIYSSSSYDDYLETLNNNKLQELMDELKQEWKNDIPGAWVNCLSVLLVGMKRQFLNRGIDFDEGFLTNDFYEVDGTSFTVNEGQILKYLMLIKNTTRNNFLGFNSVLEDGMGRFAEVNYYWKEIEKFRGKKEINEKLKPMLKTVDGMYISPLDKLFWPVLYENLEDMFDVKLEKRGELEVKVEPDCEKIISIKTVFSCKTEKDAKFCKEIFEENFLKNSATKEDLISKRDAFLMRQEIINRPKRKGMGVKF